MKSVISRLEVLGAKGKSEYWLGDKSTAEIADNSFESEDGGFTPVYTIYNHEGRQVAEVVNCPTITHFVKNSRQVLLALKPDVIERVSEKKISFDGPMNIVKRELGCRILLDLGEITVNEELLRNLYKGNIHVESCVDLYKGRNFHFFVIETNYWNTQINQKKKKIRDIIKRCNFRIESDAIGDNSVHISDGSIEAHREIEFIKNYKK